MTYETLILIFSSIIWEAMPFIVLGVLLAGILEEFVPSVTQFIPKNKLLAIGMGGLLGVVFPMCDCGIVVVMKRLLRKGLPLGVCVSYLLAGPIVNVAVMLSTYFAFGGGTTVTDQWIFGGPLNVVLLRCGLGYIVAVMTALLVDMMEQRQGLANLVHPNVLRGLNAKLEVIDESTAPRTWMDRLRNISATSLNEFVDIMAYLVIGAFLASAGRLWIQDQKLENWIQGAPALAIVIMMGLAFAFCVCSKADAFIAVNFPMYWPAASKIAFLVLGPMFDFKLVLMYTRVFRRRLMVAIFAAVCIQVFVYTMALHYVSVLAGIPPAATAPSAGKTSTGNPPATPAPSTSDKR